MFIFCHRLLWHRKYSYILSIVGTETGQKKDLKDFRNSVICFKTVIAQIVLLALLQNVQNVPLAAGDGLRGRVQLLWRVQHEGRTMVLLPLVLLPCLHVRKPHCWPSLKLDCSESQVFSIWRVKKTFRLLAFCSLRCTTAKEKCMQTCIPAFHVECSCFVLCEGCQSTHCTL